MKTLTDRYGRTITGNGDAWETDGITLTLPDATDADVIAAFEGMAPAGHVVLPEPQTTITTNEFIARFTTPEQQAVMSSTDWRVRLWIMRAAAAGDVDLASPTVREGVEALAALGLIAPIRVDQLLQA